MIVLVLENAPPRLRGRLSTLLLELRAGVYVGRANPKLRRQLWRLVEAHIDEGSAVLVWPDEGNVSGVDFCTLGENRRVAFEIDGVRLVNFAPAVVLKGSPAEDEGDMLVDFLSGSFVNQIKDIE